MPVSSGKVKEYLYKLTPLIDTQKWDRATNFLDSKLNYGQKKYILQLRNTLLLKNAIIWTLS